MTSAFVLPALPSDRLAHRGRREVALDLLQAAALVSGTLRQKYTHATAVSPANIRNTPNPPIALTRDRNEIVTTKLAAQLAIVATLIALPRIRSG